MVKRETEAVRHLHFVSSSWVPVAVGRSSCGQSIAMCGSAGVGCGSLKAFKFYKRNLGYNHAV